MKKRGFSGAYNKNYLYGWVTSNLSADAEILRDLEKLRARSRDLCRNNDYAKKFIRMVKTNVIGSGIKLQSKTKFKNARALIESAFKEWSKKGICDVTGKYSFLDIQKLVIGQIAEDGEVLVRIIKNFDNKFGFALQLLEADHLDIQFNDPSRNIFLGIEYNKWDKPIAYHLYTKHPGGVYSGMQTIERIRVPADEILHLYIPDRVSQTRGVPWLHSAILSLNMLNGYMEAELVASRLSAAKAGFYIPGENGEYTGDGNNDVGDIVQEVEPGVFEVLPQGWDFKAYDPQHPATSFKDFTKTILRSISSGLDVSYNYLSNDLESVNYSSIRAGVLDEREVWKSLQDFMIEHFVQPVFEEWLKMAILKNALNLKFEKIEEYKKASWQKRGWAWVDPLKDAQAAILSMKSGLKTASDIVSEQGRDIEEVYEQLAREKELREKHGITTIDDAQLIEMLNNINKGDKNEA